jgi:hypothetical protein
MIDDISTSNFKEIYNNEESYLSTPILEQCKPYFDVDLTASKPNEQIQWYRNLFWLTTDIDLGLSHAIQHNQSGRNYASMSSNKGICDSVFNAKWELSIGCDVDVKPSNHVSIKKAANGYVINGTTNWLTNIEVADYATISAHDADGIRHKVVIDLSNIEHTLDTNWGGSTGMRMAQPASLILDNVLIPHDCCLGKYGYPNVFHANEVLHGIAFITNMVGNVYALYREINVFAKANNRQRDYLMIDLELDVFAILNRWLSRLNQFHTPSELNASESYWNEHIHLYLFGKKTLLKAINVSRTFGIQGQLLANGAESRVFRNAITFSSHMFKLQDYDNTWGDEKHTDLNLQVFLKHQFGKLIHGTTIPETW